MQPQNIFTDKNCIRIWNDYFKRIRRITRKLDKKQQKEIIMELESHIYDSFNEEKGSDQTANLLNVLDRLGQPEEFLKPLISKKLILRGTSTYSILKILQGLYYNIYTTIPNLIISVIFTIGYIFVFTLFIMAFLKIFFPAHIGYFSYADGSRTFGIISDTTGASELLGYWIIPLCLVTGILLHIVFSYVLRLVIRRQ